jgi:putative N6-adenine-specific DNA methylase
VEKMKQKYKQEWFDENGPRYRIEVALLKDIATLTIDTTGPGLHKRGYRKLSSDAPLKETLAAAMIQLSYWNSDRILADPLCGSGTIPIEAALIGLNMAPGLKRSFIAEEWERIPRKYWDEARQEAQDLMQKERKLEILASDIDGDVLSMARYHIDQAGLQDHIKLQKLPVSEFRSRKKYGCIITNPPYGERLGEADEVKKLYQEMGKVFKPLDTWSIYILTSYPGFEQLFGRKADKRRKLYNGRIECQYYQYYGPRPPKREED